MVEAMELRIGNYVNRIVVPSMENGRIKPSIDLWRIECTDFCSLESFKPIPLTEQWLIDFGFEKKQTDVFSISLDYGVFLFVTLLKKNETLINLVETGLYSDNVCLRKICKYVHQLQNLYFALTGEDLHL